jgi:acyl-CoA synthetase (AMP-forming)/AMP-acid ligase II
VTNQAGTGGAIPASGNFGDLFWRAARLYPDKVAVEQDEVTLTYAQLEDRTHRAARLLRERGAGPGSKVLLLFPNDYRLIECLFGTLRTGAVAVPANTRLGIETLRYIAGHCDATALVAHASLADKARAMLAAAPALRTMLIVEGDEPGAESYDAAIASTPAGFASEGVRPEDLALIMYTSGSTGQPKGCMLCHANKWWQARSSTRTLMLAEGDKALVMGPLYHANALWVCLLPMLYVGGSLVILPGFAPIPVLDAIHRYRPTYSSGTPSMFSLLLAAHRAERRHDVGSLRLLLCGSAPVSAELMAALHREFHCDVVEGYGLTEGGANVITPRWGIKKLGSTGLPVPDVEIRIVDPQDPARERAPGEVGELWSRSPANALGYYKQPEVTAQRFTPDGWLRTGDLVRADEQGYIYFVGRADDMINCGGENIYPKEVENVLLAHPEVADVCVVPVAHQVKGQAPVAWVVMKPDAAAGEDEIKRFFLERGPAYAHPRRVFIVDRLPVSGTNKVDRRRLQDDARALIPGGLAAGQP